MQKKVIKTEPMGPFAPGSYYVYYSDGTRGMSYLGDSQPAAQVKDDPSPPRMAESVGNENRSQMEGDRFSRIEDQQDAEELSKNHAAENLEYYSDPRRQALIKELNLRMNPEWNAPELDDEDEKLLNDSLDQEVISDPRAQKINDLFVSPDDALDDDNLPDAEKLAMQIKMLQRAYGR